MENLKELIENNTIVIVDLETSGLDRNRDFILEVAAVKIENGEIKDKFSSFANNPQMKTLPEEIEKLTGITFDQLKSAPFIGEVVWQLYNFSKDCILVAHNLPFDFAFLRNWCFWCGISFDEFKNGVIDTVELFKQVLGNKVENYRLPTLANYFGIDLTDYRALTCAETTAKIFLELAKQCY